MTVTTTDPAELLEAAWEAQRTAEAHLDTACKAEHDAAYIPPELAATSAADAYRKAAGSFRQAAALLSELASHTWPESDLRKPPTATELLALSAFRQAMRELGIPPHTQCGQTCNCEPRGDEVETRAIEVLAEWNSTD